MPFSPSVSYSGSFVRVAFLAAIACASLSFSLSGCSSEPPPTLVCESSAECTSGYVCTEGACVLASPNVDAGRGRDAGNPFRRDAGPRPFDAGKPQVDAGQPDAGSPVLDGGSDDDADAGGICGPLACAAQGAECDVIVDGCGTLIDCGGCGAGQACGERGTPFENRCRCEPQCRPNQCGRVDDGCGARIDCGGCGTGQFCNGQNQCQCRRRECHEVGAECGLIDDGCGGKRNCGGCTDPERCGGPGVAVNQCGCVVRAETAVTDYATYQGAMSLNRLGGIPWTDLGQAVQHNTQGAEVFANRLNTGTNGGRCQPDSDGTWDSQILYLFNPQLPGGAGLDIPEDAVITGVQVQIDINRHGYTPTLKELYIVGPAPLRGSSVPRRQLDLSTGFKRFTFGANQYGWGLNRTVLNPERVNDRAFGVQLRFDGRLPCESTTRLRVDAARVRVFYYRNVCE